MFNHNSFSATSFNAVSWRFDLREQTITYARVAAHVSTSQAVVFAYSQESLRVATKVSYPVAFVTTKVSYPVAFVTTGQLSGHIKPLVAKVMTSKPARRKTSAPVQRNVPAPKCQSTQQKAFVLTEQQTAQVSSPKSGVFVQQSTRKQPHH